MQSSSRAAHTCLAVEVEGACLAAEDKEELAVGKQVQRRSVVRQHVHLEQRNGGGRVRSGQPRADAAGSKGKHDGIIDPQHVFKGLRDLHLMIRIGGTRFFDDELGQRIEAQLCALFDADPPVDTPPRVETKKGSVRYYWFAMSDQRM